MERGGLAVPFTTDMLSSLPPEEQHISHEMDPFSGQVAGGANGGGGGRNLVANGNGEGGEVVMATDGVQELAMLEPTVVLETSQFTSIVSPPTDELKMPQVQTGTVRICC